jgi:hypothetical protein
MQPDTTDASKIHIDIGVIAPCDKYRRCKIANSQTGQIMLERMGYTYWVGTFWCLRCKHLKQIDLFEDIDHQLCVRDPQAESLVGVVPSEIKMP